MFLSLRLGMPLYILYKLEQRVDIGEVMSVSLPMSLLGLVFNLGLFMAPRNTVDIRVKIGEKQIDLQKIPADMDIADFGNDGMVISEAKLAIINEVETMMRQSEKVINSVNYHLDVISKCNAIILELTPLDLKDREINNLKQEITYLKDNMSDIKAMLSLALGQKGDNNGLV